MPKLKTHKGAAKRFRLTATGKVKRGHSHARHILTKKATKRKRHLDIDALVAEADQKPTKTNAALRSKLRISQWSQVRRQLHGRCITRLTGPLTTVTTDYGLIRRDLCLAQNVETSDCTNEKGF